MTVLSMYGLPCSSLAVYNMLGDFTPNTVCSLPHWEKITGNSAAEEPRFITAHYLYHLQPELKYLVTMRNPVERYFIAYKYNRSS